MSSQHLNGMDILASLNTRSREVFRTIVETYLDSGEPVGSRSLSRVLPMALSPASIRSVMSDLEELGLVYSPHISAGRLPTDHGLRFFIDGLMQVGDLSSDEQDAIEQQVRRTEHDHSIENLLTEASQMLSGLSSGAGLVITPKNDVILKHIEFVRLEPTKALVVLVGQDNHVENRVLNLPAGTTPSQLSEAANFLNAHLIGQTLSEVRLQLENMKDIVSSELDTLSVDLVKRGLAEWSGADSRNSTRLIVRGRSNLLTAITDKEDIERLGLLFDDLEKKDGLIELLRLSETGSGVRIFIGSENKLFSLSGSSLVVAPYRDKEARIVGAVGVIGPTRLNYARVVPMVDYTAQLVSRLIR